MGPHRDHHDPTTSVGTPVPRCGHPVTNRPPPRRRLPDHTHVPTGLSPMPFSSTAWRPGGLEAAW